MLKIGDFSKLSRISIRMLRNYDESGLLTPEMTDPFTGYRYYSEAQLPVAEAIQNLKSLGFGLAAIRDILERLQPANPGYGMAIFHDEGFKEQDVDVEIQISVEGTYKDTEHVKFKTVPPVLMASATYKGSYEQITRVNAAVADWIAANTYEFAGSSFCIYHVSPGHTDNPEELVTEVCYPVRKREEKEKRE